MVQKVKETQKSRAARRGGGKRGARVPGETTISSKNQVTIPVAVLREAGFKADDKVKIEVDGPGWIRIGPADETIDQLVDRISGSLTGIYGPNYLERLRREEW